MLAALGVVGPVDGVPGAGVVGAVNRGLNAGHQARPGRGRAPAQQGLVWNLALPALVYGGLLVMALLVWRKPLPALYGVAAASLLLLFIGIRNAWDLAVWMTVDRPHGPH